MNQITRRHPPTVPTTVGLRVAVIHEWLERFAGSERVLEQILICYPDADVFALVDFMPESDRSFLQGRQVKTSFIQRLPFARKRFRNYIGLMPIAVEQFDLSGYDLVISSNHAVAKGVITGPDQLHVCYVHTPMRYAWDLQAQYLREANLERGAKGLYARWLLHRLRNWDYRSSAGVDVFLANSRYIGRRICKAYRRESMVLAPPVAVDRFRPNAQRGDYYMVASRFVPYKRIDLIVKAFAGMPDRKLIVIGDGSGEAAVHAAAVGCANIEILKPLGRERLVEIMAQAKAFVFAAEEDFGITMAEAQACGTPVIAYGVGGACDIVIDDGGPIQTGVLFYRQDVDAIRAAVDRLEQECAGISVQACRGNADRFSEAAFRHRFVEIVEDALSASRAGIGGSADLQMHQTADGLVA